MTSIRALTFAFLLTDLTGMYGRSTMQTCKSPQYVEVGSTGTIRCNFHQIYAAYWYDTTESGTNPPVIRYEDSKTAGSGLVTGEYDVHQDGSLIINTVTFSHDNTFRVIFLLEKDGDPVTEDIQVVVTVLPDLSFPMIDICEGERNCFKQITTHPAITCSVREVKPAIDLTWVKRTLQGDNSVLSSDSKTEVNNLYSSTQTVTNYSFNGNYLLLLICASLSRPSLLSSNESSILLEHIPTSISPEESIPKTVNSDTFLELPCTDREVLALVWKRDAGDESMTLLAKSPHQNFRLDDGFELTQNGAMGIQRVGLHHEGKYSCIYTDGTMERVVTYQVVVRVKPSQPHPYIDRCGYEMFCNRQLESDSEINCFVRDARPAVHLGWFRHSAASLEKIPSASQTTQRDMLYTSYENTTVTFGSLNVIALVCQSTEGNSSLDVESSVILVEKTAHSTVVTNKLVHHVQLGTDLELPCVKKQVYIIWKKEESTGVFKNVIYTSMNLKKKLDNDYSITDTNNLLIRQVEIHHEGTYLCLYGDGIMEDEKRYQVLVYIPPEPNYLVVDGCSSQQYCVLSKGREDNITCSVKGIRPVVQLDWKITKTEAISVSFSNQQVLPNGQDDTFDILLTSRFRVNDATLERVTITCRTVGTNSEAFDLATTFDVIFTEKQNQDGRQLVWIFPILIVVAGLLTAGVLWYLKRKKRNNGKPARQQHEQHEIAPLRPNRIPSDSTDAPFDIKERFIQDLKMKYRKWTSEVRPVPSAGRDLQFCVDNIFVECGLKLLADRKHGQFFDKWEPLESYCDIFTISSKRIIIEGDPGFGKSTLMLQAAYDWAFEVKNSTLKDVDIFILLRLRELGGTLSVYTAIKQTLLPNDSPLSEQDIVHILASNESVVFALDDFDEYPDRESNDSHFNSIIAADMFPQFKVILLTRISCLPKEFPLETKFIRLTGFDDHSRHHYIIKACGSDESSANKIVTNLELNTMVSDIVKVPMFFTMLAQVKRGTSQLTEEFTTATTFFKFLMSRFESRLSSKNESDQESDGSFKLEEYEKLGKAAFEVIISSNELKWEKEDLCKKIGKETYSKYIKVGILVQEDNGIFTKGNGEEVKFHHKLFSEWYTAYYLAIRLKSRGYVKVLQKLNPFDLQYLYRFTCGLNGKAAEKIISYLRSGENGDKFALVCQLEKSGKVEDIEDLVEEMCDGIISIWGEGSRLLRKSTVLLLEISSKFQIPIKSLLIDRCFNKADECPNNLGVGPDSALPPLLTLKELIIFDVGRSLTDEESDSILNYVSLCQNMETLKFQKTFQPLDVLKQKSQILHSLKETQIKVTWIPLKKEPVMILDLDEGKWKYQANDNVLDEDAYKSLFEQFKTTWKDILK